MKRKSKPNIHLLLRKHRPNEQSIERLFSSISSELRQSYEIKICVSPFHSKGLARRLAIIFWAFLNRGDVTHVTGDINFAGLLLPANKTVLTIHDSAPLGRLNGLKKRAFETFWIRLPIWRSKFVTTISTASLRELQPYIPAGRRVRVVPNCALFSVKKGVRHQGDPPVILQVGTRAHKNLESLAAAMSGLPCILHIIGELSPQQKGLLAEHSIQYKNSVGLCDADLENAFVSADIIAFLSTYEGFGLPILEGQAVGRPVLTSRLEPMQSVAGEGAALADPCDLQEIRAELSRLLENAKERQKVIDAGLRNVANYSPARIASQYASIYEECLSARQS